MIKKMKQTSTMIFLHFRLQKKITDFESQSVEKPDVNMTEVSFKKRKRS